MEYLAIVLALMIAFVLGGAYGWGLRERQAERRLSAFAKQVEQKIAEEVKNVVHIVIEKHNDTLFVYDKDKHTFMAQGKSREELESNLKSRYPDKRFACAEKNLEEVGFTS